MWPAALLVLVAAKTTSAAAYCWEEAARLTGLDPRLLYAVASVESARNHLARNEAHRHLTGSVDIGLMQINSRWLPALAREGISEDTLQNDPCVNLKVGARILADAVQRHGNSWDAIGSYNAACTTLKGEACRRQRARYAWLVYRQLPRERDARSSAPGRPASPRAGLALVSVSSLPVPE